MGISNLLNMAFSSTTPTTPPPASIPAATPTTPMKDSNGSAASATVTPSSPIQPQANTSVQQPTATTQTVTQTKENVAPIANNVTVNTIPNTNASIQQSSPLYITTGVKLLPYDEVHSSDPDAKPQVNEAVIISSLPDVSLDQKQTPQERRISAHERSSDVSTVSAVTGNRASQANSNRLSTNTLQTLTQETVIYSFLGVKVNKGELLGKGEENHGKKTHQGYETVIRILSFDGILYPEKEKEMIDQDAYRQWLMQGSSSLSIKVNKVFDGYRNFKLNLEKQKVYCHDFIPAGTKIDIESVVLDASFPPTLKRSGWGLGLTPAQIDER
jgi:hypothetical protein